MQDLPANERLRLVHALREAECRYADGTRVSRLASGAHVPRLPLRRTLGRWLVRLGSWLKADRPVRQAWEIEPDADGTCRLSVVTEGLRVGSKTETEFTGGIAYIVSGLKSLLETGAPLAPVAGQT